jgi:diguanylate cyclase (GGDEF)-like protein
LIVSASVGGSLLLTVMSLTFLRDAGLDWQVPVTIATVVPLAVATPVACTVMGLLRELERARSEAHLAATTDGLTGLFNRRRWVQIADAEVKHAAAAGVPVALLLLDIDHFKRVNDLYGHGSGDAVLQAIARVCRDTLRPTDIPARWGGEEFVVLLSGVGAESAMPIAEQLRAAIEGSVVRCGEHRVPVTASIGVISSETQDVGHDLERLLHLADAAMYLAKQEGRNRVATAPVDGPDFGSTARVRKLRTF